MAIIVPAAQGPVAPHGDAQNGHETFTGVVALRITEWGQREWLKHCGTSTVCAPNSLRRGYFYPRAVASSIINWLKATG
jgi:hypothetical protein